MNIKQTLLWLCENTLYPALLESNYSPIIVETPPQKNSALGSIQDRIYLKSEETWLPFSALLNFTRTRGCVSVAMVTK